MENRVKDFFSLIGGFIMMGLFVLLITIEVKGDKDRRTSVERKTDSFMQTTDVRPAFVNNKVKSRIYLHYTIGSQKDTSDLMLRVCCRTHRNNYNEIMPEKKVIFNVDGTLFELKSSNKYAHSIGTSYDRGLLPVTTVWYVDIPIHNNEYNVTKTFIETLMTAENIVIGIPRSDGHKMEKMKICQNDIKALRIMYNEYYHLEN